MLALLHGARRRDWQSDCWSRQQQRGSWRESANGRATERDLRRRQTERVSSQSREGEREQARMDGRRASACSYCCGWSRRRCCCCSRLVRSLSLPSLAAILGAAALFSLQTLSAVAAAVLKREPDSACPALSPYSARRPTGRSMSTTPPANCIGRHRQSALS